MFAELIRPYPARSPSTAPLDAARPRCRPSTTAASCCSASSRTTTTGPTRASCAAARPPTSPRSRARAVAEEWPVYDKELDDGARRGSATSASCCRPARRSATSSRRSATAGVPYRAETSSLVYSSREVRDLLMTLRAVDDSSDALALVAALRSSIFGCGDDDLFTYHVEHDGRWDVAAPRPEPTARRRSGRDAMRFLGELHDERIWSTPSELLDRAGGRRLARRRAGARARSVPTRTSTQPSRADSLSSRISAPLPVGIAMTIADAPVRAATLAMAVRSPTTRTPRTVRLRFAGLSSRNATGRNGLPVS